MLFCVTLVGIIKPRNAETPSVTAIVTIMTEKPLFVTNERYLSLGFDVNVIRRGWSTFNFTSERMLTLAKALAPTYLRVSGTDADRMIFSPKKNGKDKVKSQLDINTSINRMREAESRAAESKKPVEGLFPPTNFTMSAKDWDNLNMFVKAAGWRMIFGLNEQLRNGSDWDPTNAMELLDYSIKQGYSGNLDFELGNEPDLYHAGHGHVIINGTQLGNDVIFLRKMLNGEKYGPYFKNSMIVGPDIAVNTVYMTDFLNTAGGVVRGVTWHHYYGGGELKYVNNYTDTQILDSYIRRVKGVAWGIMNSSYPDLKSWQGETCTTYSPPGSDIDISYVAGFMLLDKMGLNAELGVEVFVRQTFYGLWFALVDHALHPTPAYWISLLYKRLVGRNVLETNAIVPDKSKNSRAARFYAHCTPSSAGYPKGAVTLYGMNLFDIQLHVKLLEGFELDQFLLTPGGWGGLTSRFIALNDEILVMPDDHNLPHIEGQPLPAGMALNLPSKTLGFFVIKNAEAAACMG